MLTLDLGISGGIRSQLPCYLLLSYSLLIVFDGLHRMTVDYQPSDPRHTGRSGARRSG